MLEGHIVDVGDGVEKIGLISGFKRLPVAADDTVAGYDWLEDSAVVVGFMAVFCWQDDISALVAYKVFVIWRYQKEFAFAEASCAAVISEEEITAVPLLLVDEVFQDLNSPPAIADVKTGPPDKVL